MVRPLQGSENPFGDRNCFLNQNALAGHVEEQAMSDHAFKAQHLTHAILGYSANPSVDPNASALVGSLDKARENGFATIDTLRASRTQKKELKRKRKSKGDLDVVDGEDAYVGPWAAWDREHQAGFLDSVEELPEGQAQEEEEEGPEPSVPHKKAKPKRGAGNSALADLDLDVEDPPESLPSVSSRTTGHAASNLKDALRTAQLQLDAEKTCNRELEGKNAVLEANKPKRSKKKNIPEELATYEVEIKTLAKKYGVMVEMYFLTTEAISQPMPLPLPAFNTADRYASSLAEGECLVAELNSILPDHIKRVRPSNHFQDVFASAMQTGRSDIIHKLRNNADNIFGLPKSHFVTTCECLKVPAVIEMLGMKDTSKPTYTIWFPFLFKDMRVNMRKPFSNWKPLSQVR
ncbi:hypothetical protein SCLCIDRAFT_24433 [Scleroderma citrinum Foug A]|uniref:Uncharacterized protein n=1 Tax=Scleroderma citrinum Foug A TaxID=1036808 RepID=A0A0C2ZP13_9AGAM|nr:hypothetical protein SCLCIDRAFT_24433 [Scleroderma citrinum Foug A]